MTESSSSTTTIKVCSSGSSGHVASQRVLTSAVSPGRIRGHSTDANGSSLSEKLTYTLYAADTPVFSTWAVTVAMSPFTGDAGSHVMPVMLSISRSGNAELIVSTAYVAFIPSGSV